MLILLIRKAKSDEQSNSQKDDRESFRKHDEDMKGFFLSHPKIETTESRDIMTPDGNVLAPVQGVKLGNHVQN
jgi:hypothetical protein